jgi:hypothetical protein
VICYKCDIERGIKMGKSICFTCEYLNDEDICEIKNTNQNPDSECCEKHEWCGYDMTADSYSFNFNY